MTEEQYCCDVFKYWHEMDPITQSDGIYKSNGDGKYYFWMEGIKCSCPLIYCPNCGKKLSDEKMDEKT